MKYKIEFSYLSLKNLKKISKEDSIRILRKIETLQPDPFPINGCKKIQGEENLYRIRSGDYRILYRVFEAKIIILILNIGHRKDIYKNL
jgi:mRNA interferase RelE/StbE